MQSLQFGIFERLSSLPQKLLRESELGYGRAIWWLALRVHYRYVQSLIPLPDGRAGQSQGTTNPPIDVVIPSHRGDLEQLLRCIPLALRNIVDPIGAFYVVVPPRDVAEIAGAIQDTRVSVVPEDRFLPCPREDLSCSGWIIQQLIKLQASKVVTADYYLTIDSDTFFLRPRSFFQAGRPILYYSDQYELNYNANLRRSLGIAARFPISFVCHHMLFNRDLVHRLLGTFEKCTGGPWQQAVIAGDSHRSTSWFSEFDSYANFLHATGELHERYALRHWHGCNRIERKGYEVSELELATLSRRYTTASFHLVDR